MTNLSPQQKLVNLTVSEVLKKIEIECLNSGSVWENKEYEALRAYVNYLVFGFRGNYTALKREWFGRIEIRFAASYVKLESELKGYEMPGVTAPWFERRLAEQRKLNQATEDMKKSAK